ncbi:ribose-phosphate pyrophosphokinase 4 [Tanacetum coccineum]
MVHQLTKFHVQRVDMVINPPWNLPFLGAKGLTSPEQTATGKGISNPFMAVMVVCAKVCEGDKRIVRIKEGDCAGRHVVSVDDLVQSEGTLIGCQKVLVAHGATKVSAYVTHAMFPINHERDLFTQIVVAFGHYCDAFSVILGLSFTRGDTCEGYIFITARVFLEGTPVIDTYGFHYCPSVLGGDTYDGTMTTVNQGMSVEEIEQVVAQ